MSGETSGQLLWRAHVMLRQLRLMGVYPHDGMPLDEAHAQTAVSVLSQMLWAHKQGRHTAYCTCSLDGGYG